MKNNQQNDFFKFLNLLGGSDKHAKQNAANQMISGLNKNESEELNNILKDKNKIESILNSSAAQQIIKKINGNGNGQHK